MVFHLNWDLGTPLDVSLPLPGIPQLVVALAEFLGVLGMRKLFPRRFSKAVTAALCPLLLLGQIFLRCILSDYTTMAEFNCAMLVNVVYMFLGVALLCKGNVWALLSGGSIAFVLAETSAAVVWPLAFVIFDAPTMANPLHFTVVTGMLFLFNRTVVLILEQGEMKPQQSHITATRMLMLSLIAYLFANSLYVTTGQWRPSPDVAMPFTICRATTNLCALCLIYNLITTHKRHRLEKEMIAIDGVVKSQYKQYKEYKESVNYIARQCHDLKHQLAVLRSAQHQEALAQELDKMERMIERYEAFTNTGNAVLDTILTQKMLYCREHGIQMSYTVDAFVLSGMQTADICTLFGNLLDNAIEHVESMPSLEDRQIILSVKGQGALLAVEVENRCDDALTWVGGLPHTTKADEKRHGLGCQSVVYLAEKYGGTARFQAENGWFTATILLSMSAVSAFVQQTVQ